MDQRDRAVVAAGIVLLAGAALGVQAATVDRGTDVRQVDDGEVYPGNTLIGVHSWENEGRLVEVDADGEVVWEYPIEDSRVFGIDPLRAGEAAPGITPEEDGNVVLFAVGEVIPAANCPEEHLDYEATFQGALDPQDHCVKNRVILMDRSATEIVWEYSWYDEMIHWHEVHDAVVTEDGEVAIADMGNDRAFAVAENGTVTWEWQAENHIGRGTDFFEERVPEGREDEFDKDGDVDDWTHVNDVDELENGNFQLSIRNFDTVIEVDPATGEIVDEIGQPGNKALMDHQHNPQRLEEHGTLVVADSGNDRIVEVDVEREEILWTYGGPRNDPLQWPRDADRLPNGNTLITDSRNNRVLEINETGRVVWEFRDPDGEVIPLPYEAERLPVGETADGPSARGFDDRESPETHGVVGAVRQAETLAHWVLPNWMHLPQQLTLLAAVLAGLWLVGEGALYGSRRAKIGRRLRELLDD